MAARRLDAWDTFGPAVEIRIGAQTDALAEKEPKPASTKPATTKRASWAWALFRFPRMDGRLDDPAADATLLRELGAAPKDAR